MALGDDVLGRWPVSLLRRKSGSSNCSSSCSSPTNRDIFKQDRSFDLADRAERGEVCELEQDFTMPLRRSDRLWQFVIRRSADLQEYRLYSSEGSFLMLARVCGQESQLGEPVAKEELRIEFFLYDVAEEEASLCGQVVPTFSMVASNGLADWSLWQERCERCQLSPRSAACACSGRQQIAAMAHARRRVGGGVANCMEVFVPALCDGGERPVVWCPLLGRGDLRAAAAAADREAEEAAAASRRSRRGAASSSSEAGAALGSSPLGEGEVRRLQTRLPSWDADAKTMSLDFGGRSVKASAKNFQLTRAGQKEEPVICQFAKLDPSSFILDIRYPLSVVQAFGFALTTLFWQ